MNSATISHTATHQLPHTDINVRHYGAVGDGVSDDTTAIQSAIDAAAERGGGCVWVPSGTYAVSTIRLRTFVALVGQPTWSYHKPGGTCLRLIDAQAKCLVDFTGSHGARLVGLGLEGGELGENICAVYIDGINHEEEDTLFVEHCRIAHFTGDGIRLDNVWAFTVRKNMVIFNRGDGVNFSRWDGWINENIFNNNQGYGIRGCAPNASISIVSNRIEWNYKGGILVEGGNHYHINDNYIDRSGGPAIHLRGDAKGPLHTFAITGNLIYRSGAKSDDGSDQSSHLLFENLAGLTCTGNTMHIGVNDSGTGKRSPALGIVLEGLQDSIIQANTLFHGATMELVTDLGGHGDGVIVRDNVGRLAPGTS